MLNRCDFRCVLKVENFRDKCRSDLLEGSSSTWTGDGKSTVAYGWARRIWHQNFSRECRTYVDGFEVLNRVTREWRTVGGWWGLQVRGDMPWMYPPPEITAPSRIWYEYGLVPVFQIFSMRVIWTIYIIIIIFRWVTHRIGVRIPRWSDQRLTETFSCATVRLYWLECRTTFGVSRSKVNATKSCKAPTKMTKGRT